MSASLELLRGQYLGEISALSFIHLPPHLSSLPLLLAGTGSQILVYNLDTGEIIRSFQVFEGIRVHGISLERFNKQVLGSTIAFRIAVYGERRVKLFTLKVGSLLNLELTLIQTLPKFAHWVLDICFLKSGDILREDACYLAVGCSDNVVYFWDIVRYAMFSDVKCSVKCLLYSMRMLGNEIESLRIASGTIFNEIVVWKVAHRDPATITGSTAEDNVQQTVNVDIMLPIPKYKDIHISRLVGHEGSIFSIAWFSNGLKLVSVSDDRSARIWEVQPDKECTTQTFPEMDNHMTGPILFGHNARIWDCCISDSLIITAGEDCTCRVWDHDGRELKQIKEHIGRGVWRCLYDPGSSLIVTAGFDSAIKVHQFLTSSTGLEKNVAAEELDSRKEVFTVSLPNSSGHGGLMDSKSEYVRCLHFTREDSLYVATNNGYLHHASLFKNGTVKWTELAQISTGAPIICMDILSNSNCSGSFEDCVAVGDGKGSLTVIQVVGSEWPPKVEYTLTWSAEKERHLLSTYWCNSIDNRFIFTADPGGRLKLWKLIHNSPSASLIGRRSYESFLIAEYASCFGMRIMCVDASFNKELLVCGDIRGNLLLFSLPKDLLCGTSVAAEEEAYPPLNYFKGAHGVSSVCSVSIDGLCSNQVEIRSTGTDGCICYLQYDINQLKLEFLGMKQVKELSAIRSVFSAAEHSDDSDVGKYAVGFASENFIIWNLTSGTKVIQITCGGWRRPHSYYLGDLPEVMSCFCFVKNDVLYIHRQWVPENDRQIYPRHLHFQFHGREIHSLCFIYGQSGNSDENMGLISGYSWIATGCEDGTVRLTRYEPGVENWSSSKLLGEHVGGSAVRSICSVSKIYTFTPGTIDMINGTHEQNGTVEDRENPYILISVGAKRVVTAWKQMTGVSNRRVDAQCSNIDNENENITHSSPTTVSSLSFQWLSTDMPSKHTHYVNKEKTKEFVDSSTDSSTNSPNATVGSLSSEGRKSESNFCLEDNNENDWRYLDVTSFLVQDAGSRISVCFVVIACSDATVTLRALVLPFRLWFDVASLATLSSPVLALQHVVIPKLLPSTGNMHIGNLYILITGSTNGNIAFWDLTECVEKFMQRLSSLQIENYKDFQKRPRTGRGSQGGRLWRSIDGPCAKKKSSEGITHKDFVLNENTNTDLVSAGSMESGNDLDNIVSKTFEKSDTSKSSPETAILEAMHVVTTVHQSGVNCLHVSDIKDHRHPDSQFSFYVVSGGDDQSINCIRCDLELSSMTDYSRKMTTKTHCMIQNHQMQFLYLDKITSGHSSAVKGIWTDGVWVFSVGLDQRVRCWIIGHDSLTEYSHLIISVPEPEALDVKVCGRNHYQIAVAGRGMQMVDFVPSTNRT